MKIYATFRYCCQIGPNDWEMETKIFEVQPTTTIAEVVAWYTAASRKAKNVQWDHSLELVMTEQATDDQD